MQPNSRLWRLSYYLPVQASRTTLHQHWLHKADYFQANRRTFLFFISSPIMTVLSHRLPASPEHPMTATVFGDKIYGTPYSKDIHRFLQYTKFVTLFKRTIQWSPLWHTLRHCSCKTHLNITHSRCSFSFRFSHPISLGLKATFTLSD